MNHKQLTRGIIADLITDIRFCNCKIDAGINVEEEIPYRDKCMSELRHALKMRHSPRMTRYGWLQY